MKRGLLCTARVDQQGVQQMQCEAKLVKYNASALLYDSSQIGESIWHQQAVCIDPQLIVAGPNQSCALRSARIQVTPLVVNPATTDPGETWDDTNYPCETLNRFNVIATPGVTGLTAPPYPSQAQLVPFSTYPAAVNVFHADYVNTTEDSSFDGLLCTGSWKGNGWRQAANVLDWGDVDFGMTTPAGIIATTALGGGGVISPPVYACTQTLNPWQTISYGEPNANTSFQLYGGDTAPTVVEWEGCITSDVPMGIWFQYMAGTLLWEGEAEPTPEWVMKAWVAVELGFEIFPRC